MKRVSEISCCMECGWTFPGASLDTCWCCKMQPHKFVENTETIPDWCPLPTIQSYCTSNYNPDEDQVLD